MGYGARGINQPSARNTAVRHGTLRDQRGFFSVVTTLAVIAIFGFIALGIEVGKWYIVRAELSKSVDAAALLGAKNISNPYLDSYFGVGNGQGLAELVKVAGAANFTPGFFGAQAPQITMVGAVENGKVKVQATTDVFNNLARTLETPDNTGQYEKTHVGALGAAQQRAAEVMLILDQSGSMSGPPIDDLKVAATSFLEYFEDTEDNDKFGLITFASGIPEEPGYDVTYHMQHYFVSGMSSIINAMIASGGTNAEDALDRADGNGGFTDQSGVPGDQRIQQFLVFFSDGNPTAFRGQFVRNGVSYDAVGYAASWDITLMQPNQQFAWLSGVKQYKTGDGLPTSSTTCVDDGNPYANTKWLVLQDPVYGVSNYSSLIGTSDPEQCDINKNNMRNYVDAITKQMAIDHAQELKNKGIKIYTVGLGAVDPTFLSQIASGPAFEYYTPDSQQLLELFQQIATNIKLRLVQA